MKLLLPIPLLAGLAASSPLEARQASFSGFAGTNAYWLPFLTNDADITTAFNAMRNAGMRVVRTWAFNDATSCSGIHFQCWSGSTATINTGANGLQRLDAVVRAAEAAGIRLILPFVNNWGDYGGMAVYRNAFGVSGASAWYTNTNIQNAYRRYVSTVVNRYRSSPAIFAWELANEPRCQGCATSVITNWARDTSAYIKSLDSSHYVLLGDEGFFNRPGSSEYPYQGGEGVDFEANLQISTLDAGVFHMYISSWGMTNDWGDKWIRDHNTACAAAGKQCILEEYGVNSDGDVRTTVMTQWHNTLLQCPSIPADMFWQFGVQLSNGPTHDDTYTIYTTEGNFQSLVVNWATTRNGGSPPVSSVTSRTTTATTATSSTSTRPSTTTTTTPTATQTGGTCTNQRWAQCGGRNWTGQTCCASGSTCRVQNEWYSQCL